MPWEGLLTTQSLNCPDLLVENASGEMSRNLHRMKVAEASFLDWTSQKRLSRATLQGEGQQSKVGPC